MVVAEALHQIFAAADRADREPAPEGLAVGDQIGTDAEIFLRSTSRDPKPYEHFIENQNDVALACKSREGC